MTNSQIATQIQQYQNIGGALFLSTRNAFQDELPPKMTGGGYLYFDHQYVVTNVSTAADGSVTSVTLVNPWGRRSGDDYQIVVPFDDFQYYFDEVDAFMAY